MTPPGSTLRGMTTFTDFQLYGARYGGRACGWLSWISSPPPTYPAGLKSTRSVPISRSCAMVRKSLTQLQYVGPLPMSRDRRNARYEPHNRTLLTPTRAIWASRNWTEPMLYSKRFHIASWSSVIPR